MRIPRIAAVVGSVALAATGLLAGTVTPAATVTPTITVSPDRDLLQEDWVTVTGAGFVARDIVVLEWCPSRGSTCRLGAYLQTDADGGINGEVAAEFRTVDALGRPSNCTVEGCSLRVTQTVGTTTLRASAPVRFDPTQEPLPPQSLTVTPTAGLRDHHILRVSGAGFAPDAVHQCAFARGVCLPVDTEVVMADDGSSFTADLEVRRFVTGLATPPIDCATTVCVVSAEAAATPIAWLTTPITFDATAPSDPLPTASVTPRTDLPAVATVSVQGRRFAPGEPVAVRHCLPVPGYSPCEYRGQLTADATGAVGGAVTLHRVLRVGGSPDTDCATSTVRCQVALLGVTSGTWAVVDVTFDPDRAAPSMAVDPDALLPFRGFVTVRGTDLPPNTSFSASECATGLAQGACGAQVRGTSDGDGELALRVPIRRRLASFTVSELGYTYFRYDCIRLGTTCAITLSSADNDIVLTAPITFDPAAPVPPSPTVAAAPATGIGARQIVWVHGAGFLPDTVVAVAQCSTTPDFWRSEVCGPISTTTSDPAGRISTGFTARRTLGSGFGTPTDCAAAVGACVVRASTGPFPYDDTEVVRAPLGFDPSAPPPPSPPVTVTPRTDLTDGQTVTVTGEDFTSNASIGFAMCKAGTTFSLLDCDITDPTWFVADASGGFTHTYDVRSHLPTGHGNVDCSVAAGTCVLAVVNRDDYSEFSLTPVTFRPESGPTPVVSAVSRSITEPTTTFHSTKVDIVLSEPTDHVVRVQWQTGVDGTATGTSDFRTVTGDIIRLLPGQTRVTVRVDVLGDHVDEADEWLPIRLFSPFGATVGPDGRLTIRDTDPPPALRVGSATVRETDGLQFALVPVTLNHASERPVTVHFATYQYTARAGRDFVATTGSLSIPPGRTRGTIAVVVLGDDAHERPEGLQVSIDRPTNATIADANSVLTIHDDD